MPMPAPARVPALPLVPVPVPALTLAPALTPALLPRQRPRRLRHAQPPELRRSVGIRDAQPRLERAAAHQWREEADAVGREAVAEQRQQMRVLALLKDPHLKATQGASARASND